MAISVYPVCNALAPRVSVVVALVSALGGSTFVTSVARAVSITPSDFAPGASVITFETGTTAPPTIPGVAFIEFGGFGGSSSAKFVGAEFGNQAYGDLVGSTFTDLAIQFTTPQPAIGGWVGKITNFLNNAADQMTLKVYGPTTTNLLETLPVTLPSQLDVPVFAGIARPEGIARIEWVGGNTGFFGIDNVKYGALVPEPTSCVTITMMGAALAVSRRRRG
jgi:hypothetical protein